MRRPSARNSPVDQDRLDLWEAEFAGYRAAVTPARIIAWLNQFEEGHRDVAARVLDAVEFYNVRRVSEAYRQTLSALPGWHSAKRHREGEWRFAAMSASAGESGDTMLHQFRIANKLTGAKYRELFVHPSQLVQQRLGPDDTIVLLDDFVGTGKQVCDAWNDAFSELVAGCGRVLLVVVAALRRGRDQIAEKTALELFPAHLLSDRDDVFSPACTHFTAAEKASFLKYCEKASRGSPAGYGDCGLVVVFSHRCPNNSAAALHNQHDKWRALFPRD